MNKEIRISVRKFPIALYCPNVTDFCPTEEDCSSPVALSATFMTIYTKNMKDVLAPNSMEAHLFQRTSILRQCDFCMMDMNS